MKYILILEKNKTYHESSTNETDLEEGTTFDD